MAKGIAIGVGLGTIIGAILDEIILFFALGGVIGIIISLIFSVVKRINGKDKLSFSVKVNRHRKTVLLFSAIIIVSIVLIITAVFFIYPELFPTAVIDSLYKIYIHFLRSKNDHLCHRQTDHFCRQANESLLRQQTFPSPKVTFPFASANFPLCREANFHLTAGHFPFCVSRLSLHRR